MSKRNRKYLEYLKSPEWKEFRIKILNQRGKKCEKCDCTDNLHLHHLTYERLGNELPEDVQVLCRNCHFEWHNGASALLGIKRRMTRRVAVPGLKWVPEVLCKNHLKAIARILQITRKELRKEFKSDNEELRDVVEDLLGIEIVPSLDRVISIPKKQKFYSQILMRTATS